MPTLFRHVRDWIRGSPHQPGPSFEDTLLDAWKRPGPELERFLGAIDAIGSSPDEKKRDAAEEEGANTVERFHQWLDGKPPFLPKANEIRRNYANGLWRLMGQLRRRGMFEEAFDIWALLAATTDESNPEVVFLAVDAAREYDNVPSLQTPRTQQWLFWIVLEAMCVVHPQVPADVKEQFDKLFNLLRIDWDQPPLKRASRPVQLIEKILPLASTFPNEYTKRLTFWKNVAEWRSKAQKEWASQAAVPSPALLNRFVSLVVDDPDAKADFDKAFSMLRIASDQPHREHVSRSKGWIVEVLRRASAFPSGHSRLLTFWREVAKWRLQGDIPPEALLGKFESLIADGPDGKADLDSAFSLLRIAWDQPRLEHVHRSMRRIDQFLPLASAFSKEHGQRLLFWKTLGKWRLQERVSSDDLLEQFRSLITDGSDDPESRMLYCWCALRICYESASDPLYSIQTTQVEAIREEWHRHNGNVPSTNDSAEELATYFRALTWSERALGWREGKLVLTRKKVKTLCDDLRHVPQVVQAHKPLKDHIGPVVDTFKRRVRGSRLWRR